MGRSGAEKDNIHPLEYIGSNVAVAANWPAAASAHRVPNYMRYRNPKLHEWQANARCRKPFAVLEVMQTRLGHESTRHAVFNSDRDP